MSLEGFSRKGMELGNNPEQIYETKNDLRQQYLNAIKRLALQKMKNDLLFEGSLGAAMRRLSSLGLDVSKESMLKDIETEVTRQRMSFDIEVPNVSIEEPNVNAENQSQIEKLNINLRSIFESAPVQEQKTIYNSGTIPREPAIQNIQPYETAINNASSQINQPVQTPVNNEQEIRQQLQQAQEEIKQKLEWAKKQPNEPTVTFTGNLEKLSDDIKQRIIQQMESRGEVIISSIDNIYQEGNYIAVDAKDNQGRFIGTEFTLDDFTKLVNQPSNIAKTEEISQQQTDNMIKPQVQEQQKQMKNQIISQIMVGMNNAGEFSFGDISLGERMNIMQNAQNILNSKSMDELQMILSTYQEQNVQEENMSSGMQR